MTENKSYDILIFGNYTKDTIVSKKGTRYVDGGGFNYGAHAAANSGKKVAAVTRLAREDIRVIDKLQSIGVDVYPTFTPSSTHMKLEYISDNPDERILTCTKTAGTYTIDQFDGLKAKAILINGSVREEAPLELVRELRKRDSLLVADAQGFIRIVAPDKTLVHADWPEQKEVLALIDILKADIVEAESLTGEKNIHKAAKILNKMGPKEIVITHKDGIVVYAEDIFYEQTFKQKELVGRSGRGDTCIASYVASRLTNEPAKAIVWSAAVTSLKLEAEGPFNLGIDEIKQMIAENYS
ncbi:MAG: bifunctional hydroxymethylpyrimidine kinase/phosphomethylpyrimidine kinase [Melioribacteraceae bacterium]|nr:bifunctional hydroxymethylpyrimidine kinase/phosphomethylpyrimidine kinase [Melioribacteraceae bacterium]